MKLTLRYSVTHFTHWAVGTAAASFLAKFILFYLAGSVTGIYFTQLRHWKLRMRAAGSNGSKCDYADGNWDGTGGNSGYVFGGE